MAGLNPDGYNNNNANFLMNHQLTAVVAFLFIAVVASDTCSYKKFSPNHTACKPRNSSCNIVTSNLTEREINLVVKLHNQNRDKVALGKETAAGGLPTASDMMEMVWDKELAMIAQRHAELCKQKHDCDDCRRVDRFKVGQNLYERWSTNDPSNSTPIWEEMVKDFYSEVGKFKKENISPFKPIIGSSHFTQMVWAESWALGCGKVVYKEGKNFKSLLTCNYGPAGNVIGKSMYKEGKPCSACPPKTCCGDSCKEVRSEFKGLCKKIK